jgi:hypothetical protein
MKRKEDPESVSEGVWSLSCGPAKRVKISAACKINGVRYSTVDREKFLQTHNSGVMTEISHAGKKIDFFGVLQEVIELQYNSNHQVRRTVVLFRCDWFNQVGKTVGLRVDKHFKSINVHSFWYKNDPFILAEQSNKVFYLQDTSSQGKDWRVVQKFEHRAVYDVAEADEGSHEVHQDEYGSDTEHAVEEGDVNEVLPNVEGGEATIFEGNLDELIRNKKQVDSNLEDSDDEEEDDTIMQYCSDGGDDNNDDMDDEDF